MALTNPLKFPLKLGLRTARILSVLALGGISVGFVVGPFSPIPAAMYRAFLVLPGK